MKYTAADVQNILTGFAEEFAVDVKAKHTPEGDYLIDFTDLVSALVLGEEDWYEEIANYVNVSTTGFILGE